MNSNNHSAAGYTVPELLTVMVMAGVLVAIAAPSWHSFQLNRKLNSAQDSVLQAMRQAQTQAKLSHFTWQASFREAGNAVQFAIHPAASPSASVAWQTVPNVRVDPGTTTLSRQNAIYRLQFNHQGQINGQLGRLTLTTEDSSKLKRCVFASTLLGALRKAADQACQ